MKDIEKLVKDKAMFYWLDIEISFIQLVLYLILGAIINRPWAWWITIAAVIAHIVYMVRVGNKLDKLKLITPSRPISVAGKVLRTKKGVMLMFKVNGKLYPSTFSNNQLIDHYIQTNDPLVLQGLNQEMEN